MRETICTCDRCGKEITDGVVYELTCYAENVKGVGISMEGATHNLRQNEALTQGRKDLCADCKNELTDGMFIV